MWLLRIGLAVCSLVSAFAMAEPLVVPNAPPFYAFCVTKGVPGLAALSPAEEAKLAKEVGFEGLGHPLWIGADLDKNLQILDQAGLKPFLLYTSINLKNPEKAYDPRIVDSFAKLKGRPVTINVLLVGLPPSDPRGVEPAVKILRELGDAAAKQGLNIAIYNHVGNWTERVPFAAEVIKKVDRPNVGISFILCHYLKTDGDKDPLPLLRKNASKLFGVTICGAQRGAKTWTNGLIQPLDRGDFDNRALLLALRELGYRGPIGLHCFGVPGDPLEHLQRSMSTWRSWHAAMR